jgi:hypothetical protein
MPIVGFDFTRINVERNEVAKGKINISNNVGIADIERNDLSVGNTKQAGLRFIFEYKSLYEPSFAKIELGGHIIYLTDDKNADEIVNEWKREKKISKEIAEKIINTVLAKCNIQSIILSNTVNLPPPVPMPKVNVAPASKTEKKEERKEESAEKKSGEKTSGRK